MLLNKLYNSFLRGEGNRVFAGMITLLLGSGAAKLVGLASIPFLTRIYSSEDFGVLSIYISLVATLAPVLTLRYVQAVPLPRSDVLAANILALSICSLLIVTIALSLMLYFFGENFLITISMEPLIDWRWLIVVGVVGAGVYEALTLWATRKKHYRIIAKTQFAQSIAGAAFKIFLGILAFKPGGLLFGQFAAQTCGVGTYLRYFRQDTERYIGRVGWAKMRLVAQYYSGYPFFRLPSQLLLIFSIQAPIFFAATFYGAEITGQLGLALMALAIPVELLGESMSKAFYAEIANLGKNRPHEVRRLTHVVIKRLFWLSVMPSLILILAGEKLFPIVFGEQWVEAGQFASVLAVCLVFQFIQKPVSYLMFVFDGQKQLLYLSFQRVVVTTFCFWGGWQLDLGVLMTVLVYSLALSLHYLFSIFLAIKKIPIKL